MFRILTVVPFGWVHSRLSLGASTKFLLRLIVPLHSLMEHPFLSPRAPLITYIQSVRFERQMKERSRYIHVIRHEKAEHQAIMKVKKELQLQEKKDRVRQLLRQKEYRRERQLAKLDAAEQRLKKTMQQKQDLINQRKEAAIGVARRKFQLKQSMSLIRTSGKWELMECLDEDGTISKAKRRKQLRAKRRAKKAEDALAGGSP